MDGKKQFVNLLSKTFDHHQLSNSNSSTRFDRAVQNFSGRSTSNQGIFKRETRIAIPRGSSQPKGTKYGTTRQRTRQVVYGLRTGRRSIPMAKQGQGYGVPRTPRRTFMRPGEPKKPEKPTKPKKKPHRAKRGVGIVYKSKNFRSKLIRKSSNGKYGRISGTEFLVNLNPADTVRAKNGAVMYEAQIAPILVLGSRLAQEAKMWQEYRVVTWKYIFTSACPTTTSGQIGIGVTADCTMSLNEGGDTAIRKFETLECHKEFNPFQSQAVEFLGHKNQWFKVSPAEDSVLFIAGKCFFLVYSPLSLQAVVNTLGKVHIEYELEFREPFIQPGLVPIEEAFGANLTSDGIAANAGEPYTLATSNFSQAPQANSIYQLVITANWTEGGQQISLGTTNYSMTMSVGTVWYMKRDTKTNLYYFYDYEPDDNPVADDSIMIRTGATPVSRTLAGTAVFYPMGELQI